VHAGNFPVEKIPKIFNLRSQQLIEVEKFQQFNSTGLTCTLHVLGCALRGLLQVPHLDGFLRHDETPAPPARLSARQLLWSNPSALHTTTRPLTLARHIFRFCVSSPTKNSSSFAHPEGIRCTRSTFVGPDLRFFSSSSSSPPARRPQFRAARRGANVAPLLLCKNLVLLRRRFAIVL
jgi:hypothetical protein